MKIYIAATVLYRAIPGVGFFGIIFCLLQHLKDTMSRCLLYFLLLNVRVCSLVWFPRLAEGVFSFFFVRP